MNALTAIADFPDIHSCHHGAHRVGMSSHPPNLPNLTNQLLLPTLLAFRGVEAASKKVHVSVWNHENDCTGAPDKVKEVKLNHCSKNDVYGRSVLLHAPARLQNYDNWANDADQDHFVSLYSDKKCKHIIANITVPSGLEKCWSIPAGQFARGFKFRSEKRATPEIAVAAKVVSDSSGPDDSTSLPTPTSTTTVSTTSSEVRIVSPVATPIRTPDPILLTEESSATVTATATRRATFAAEVRSNITGADDSLVTNQEIVVVPILSGTPVIPSNVSEIVVPVVTDQAASIMGTLTATKSLLTIIRDYTTVVTVWATPGQGEEWNITTAIVSDVTVVKEKTSTATVWVGGGSTIKSGSRVATATSPPTERAEILADPIVESRAALKKYEVNYFWYKHPWEMTPVCFKCWLFSEHGRKFGCVASKKTEGLCPPLTVNPPKPTPVTTATEPQCKRCFHDSRIFT